jgi:hypothetical protein
MSEDHLFVIAVLAAVLIGMAPPALAMQSTSISATRADAERLMSALAHHDYAKFVKDGTIEFHRLSKAKFEKATQLADARLPLQKPYTLKFLATERVPGYLNYVFEVTWQDRNQSLAIVTLQDGKVAGFHLE